ncbi:NUDIX domain-containing protein [candidate division KSB1 bacterium]|nr:NUDIX domain-containing protein [candidate division KSB1 bacterium]
MDRKTLIKNFTLGFLPLLIFIIADELFELTISLAIALAVGIIELTVTYIRERRFDAFILLDIGLIASLGLVSVSLNDPVFILIKPAIIESIFVILIGVTIFTDNPILINMSRRYMKGMELGDQQIYMMRRMLVGMFWLMLLHVGLIVLAALYVGSPEGAHYTERKELWAFVSGGLFYILIGAIFGIQFIKGKLEQRRFMKQYADDEWFDIVTPEGKVTGKAPRTICHGNPNLLHPVVHLHVFNSQRDLWLQKRAKDKQIAPDLWDTSVGGHVFSGEKIEDALLREMREELGISKMPHQPLFTYIMKNQVESELVFAYQGFHNGPFVLPVKEIQEGRFWKIRDIRKNLGKGVFTPNFEQEFQLLEKVGALKGGGK